MRQNKQKSEGRISNGDLFFSSLSQKKIFKFALALDKGWTWSQISYADIYFHCFFKCFYIGLCSQKSKLLHLHETKHKPNNTPCIRSLTPEYSIFQPNLLSIRPKKEDALSSSTRLDGPICCSTFNQLRWPLMLYYMARLYSPKDSGDTNHQKDLPIYLEWSFHR